MSTNKQLSLFKNNQKKKKSSSSRKPKVGRKPLRPKNVFGGKYFLNYNPSIERPIDQKKALHLVLRSTQAKGAYSFKNHKFEMKIWEIIKKHAQLNEIKIYEYANASNHLHLLIRAKFREGYVRFIRTVTGLIARLVSGAQRGCKLKKKFWDARPFSRIVSFSKKEFQQVRTYILQNTLETIGFIPYISRSKKLPPKWKQFWKNRLEPA